MDEKNTQAIKILQQGGIVIFPTDTAFGIGCRIDDAHAVERLFSIRKRPLTQAVPVLVRDIHMAQKYLQPIPERVASELLDRYWPGALTVILLALTQKIPSLVLGGGTTLGVRQPNHPVAQALIQGVGVPLLGPSANVHGEKTPYAHEDLDPELVKHVDFVVEGICTVQQASTVVDCSGEPWKILRQGAIALKVER